MNNFEFQKLMNLKSTDQQNEDKKLKIKDNDISLDDKIKDDVEVLTLDEIEEKRNFNNELNNINLKDKNK